ncbi:MAG: thiol:disulfide interchange protein DsbA/DsbL [Halioglobus sp.]
MFKRALLTLSLAFLSLSCSAAEEAAPAPSPYEEGKHYTVITPALRTTNPNAVEVAEFFWYGCSHCYTFETMIGPWKKALADDVVFRGIPAVWRQGMDLHARAYYTAEALGVMDPMHQVIFKAMNVDRKPLASKSEIRKLFTANGVTADDFDATFESFGVGSQVNKGVSTGRSAKISGTPSMMVNGKYLITTRGAGDQAGMLKVVDYLVEKERKMLQK